MNLIRRHPVVMGLIIMVSAALGAGVNHWLIGGTSAGQDASQNASQMPRRCLAECLKAPVAGFGGA